MNLFRKVKKITQENTVSLADLFKHVSLDWKEVVWIPGTGDFIGQEEKYFKGISPRRFLNFAKLDVRQNDQRGNVNAVSNAKRAIDARVDSMFSHFELQDNSEQLKTFIKNMGITQSEGSNLKIDAIQALGMVPTNLVEKVRNLRNNLEHEYKEPTENETSETVELAELFLLSTGRNIEDNARIISGHDYDNYEKGEKLSSGEITIDFNKEQKAFAVECSTKSALVKNTEVDFYYLWHLVIATEYETDLQESFKSFMQYIKHPFPQEKIKIYHECNE